MWVLLLPTVNVVAVKLCAASGVDVMVGYEFEEEKAKQEVVGTKACNNDNS